MSRSSYVQSLLAEIRGLEEAGSSQRRIFLVRHGESEANVSNVINGDPHVPLTSLGHGQAKIAGEEIAGKLGERPIHIVSSPFKRAHDTARYIADALKIPHAAIQTHAGLRERHFGEYEGRPDLNFSKIPGYLIMRLNKPGGTKLQAVRANENWRPSGGESLVDVQSRTVPAMHDLLNQHPDKDLVISTHGHVIRALHAHFNGTWEKKIPRPLNAEVRMFDYEF